MWLQKLCKQGGWRQAVSKHASEDGYFDGALCQAHGGCPKAVGRLFTPGVINLRCRVFCLTKDEHIKMKNMSARIHGNIKDARRNSEQIGLVQTSWGPLFDHCPGFNNLSKFAKMVPFPSPRRSGLVVGPPAWNPCLTQPGVRFDSSCVCSNLGVSGWAQCFFLQAK